ncbi:hypothetical protein [Streptomyces albipurpureus]|uniref:Uncharacterized protein n=1 Tax=Streptomyces albipurpureus TaxID=2897419 RepID=A0ABT0UMZ6_9ACTN|nr:hypothetical protein [Streptomyces sp. CWNU-1]MCM2388778.1 hypothetical protein [Streptomyces sp. CWNU-1]
MSDVVHVRITVDGACFIDDEYFAAPPGVSINEAVLAHLQLESAALEISVRATIRDEQADYTTDIEVNPDGTSQPVTARAANATTSPGGRTAPTTGSVQPAWSSIEDPIPPGRPYAPLPQPYRTALQAVCATANHNKFTAAAREADRLLADLTAEYGPDHLYTLSVGLVRGDIAWLAKDYRYGWESWNYMARAWNQHLGPEHITTIRAVGNSVGCWHRLMPGEALSTAPQVVALLGRIPVPGSEQALKRIHHRRSLLARASKSE